MRRDLAWVLAAAAWCCACGAEEERAPATLTELEDEIFHKSCAFSTCHSGASPAAELDLSGDVFGELVDVDSSAADDRTRVVSGDIAASYLIEKLTSDTPAEGERMPIGTPLTDDKIRLIESWIQAGARDD